MKRIVATSEIVGSFTKGEHEYEVCATGDANFDEGKAQLQMDLDSFIRPVDLLEKEKHVSADWLPSKQSVNESVSREDAPDLAKEVFQRWVGKVRRSIPLPIHI